MSSEAIETTEAKIYGRVAYVGWVNSKTENEAKKQVITDALGKFQPAWITTSNGLSDVSVNLEGHLLQKASVVYAEKGEKGGAIPGTGVSATDYDKLSDDEKKTSGLKPYPFYVVAVKHKHPDGTVTLTPAIFEAYNYGLVKAVQQAEVNFGKAGLDKNITLVGGRIGFVGTCSMGKTPDGKRPQTQGNCTVSRIFANTPAGELVNKAANDPQFRADTFACVNAISRKIQRIIEGETETAETVAGGDGDE